MSVLNKSWLSIDIDSKLNKLHDLMDISFDFDDNERQLRISLGSIIKRASQAARTAAWRGVKEKYNIKQEHFYKYIKVKTYDSSIDTYNLTADVTFAGQKIPLYYFGNHSGKEKSRKPVESQIIKGGKNFNIEMHFICLKIIVMEFLNVQHLKDYQSVK